MSTTIDELADIVAKSSEYLVSENLDVAYIESRVVPALRAALEEAVSTISERHKVAPADLEGGVELAHYTSMRVLYEMLSRVDTLRLYDSIHLNDPDEGRYLTRHIASMSQYDWMVDPLELVLSGQSGVSEVENAYVTSFVAGRNVQDNLVFWRTYGHEGTGCSIVCSVDTEILNRVIYGEKELEPTIDSIRPVLDCLAPIVAKISTAMHVSLVTQVWKSLMKIAYLYKSSAYKYEKEYRVVVLESDVKPEDVKFHYRDSATGSPRIRHYVERSELNIDTILPSASLVTIGPCVPFADDVRRRLSMIANSSGLTGRPEITSSKISYRSP